MSESERSMWIDECIKDHLSAISGANSDAPVIGNTTRGGSISLDLYKAICEQCEKRYPKEATK